jgi:hypothetical protein
MVFCQKCGKEIDGGAAFCPSCGAPAGGQPNNGPSYNSGPAYAPGPEFNNPNGSYGSSGNYQNQNKQDLGSNLTIVVIFGILWAIISLPLGFIGIYGGFILVPLAISGLFAVITIILILMRKSHTLALVLCIIGSALGLICFIIPGIFGLFMAYLLHQSKDKFIS